MDVGSMVFPIPVSFVLKENQTLWFVTMLADVIDHIELKNNIRTDSLTMSIYSSIMVAGTPICKAIFSAVLGMAGYDQTAVVGETVQTAAAQSTITGCYIWTETIAFAVCAAMMILWTVEKKLPEEQEAIKQCENEG